MIKGGQGREPEQLESDAMVIVVYVGLAAIAALAIWAIWS